MSVGSRHQLPKPEADCAGRGANAMNTKRKKKCIEKEKKRDKRRGEMIHPPVSRKLPTYVCVYVPLFSSGSGCFPTVFFVFHLYSRCTTWSRHAITFLHHFDSRPSASTCATQPRVANRTALLLLFVKTVHDFWIAIVELSPERNSFGFILTKKRAGDGRGRLDVL